VRRKPGILNKSTKIVSVLKVKFSLILKLASPTMLNCNTPSQLKVIDCSSYFILHNYPNISGADLCNLKLELTDKLLIQPKKIEVFALES